MDSDLHRTEERLPQSGSTATGLEAAISSALDVSAFLAIALAFVAPGVAIFVAPFGNRYL